MSKTRKPRRAKGRNAGRSQGNVAPTAIRLRPSSGRGLGKELEEAREQQAATSEVLEAINRSGFNLDEILQTLVSTAARLCKTGPADIFLLEGDVYRFRAGQNLSEPYLEHEKRAEIRAGLGTLVGRVALRKGVVRIADALEDIDYEDKEAASTNNLRSMLGVPLMRNGEPVGVFALARTRVEPFSESQIRLVSTFANQAVIAIENTRLFSETQEALERQKASADILRVISSSIAETRPVFNEIVNSVQRLFRTEECTIFLLGLDGLLHIGAMHGAQAELVAPLFPIPLKGTAAEIALRERRLVTYDDVLNDDGVPEGLRVLARRIGQNYSVAVAPMLAEDRALGALVVGRFNLKPFVEKEGALLQSLADQAVIAIENVGLFNEVQQRTRELSQSLHDLRAAQDRLVQTEKLAALGQLTAGIAHEIKNPLNFVNNFSTLSAELTDELNDTLKGAALTDKLREEVSELTKLLKENLAKVVQHGKRADSIVKNMLLHSREGSREQRPTDVNALVDESLNLAYHGARAEKSSFEISLQRDFDAKVGTVELFPQEVSRALLNLLSNSFYAATKRKVENGGAGAEPTVLATTKNLGSSVEIRIRDNGAGIPPEVREKMFNPFFTTKPTGEGTGLGLSMTHDIIVKQHGGSIDVETRLGEFTEFIITLPRNNRTVPG